VHITSIRGSPSLLSTSLSIRSAASGWLKLGQPVPESNFVAELNRKVPQQTQV
jgi:hypothetical protein